MNSHEEKETTRPWTGHYLARGAGLSHNVKQVGEPHQGRRTEANLLDCILYTWWKGVSAAKERASDSRTHSSRVDVPHSALQRLQAGHGYGFEFRSSTQVHVSQTIAPELLAPTISSPSVAGTGYQRTRTTLSNYTVVQVWRPIILMHGPL